MNQWNNVDVLRMKLNMLSKGRVLVRGEPKNMKVEGFSVILRQLNDVPLLQLSKVIQKLPLCEA